ncbi:NfeD family protein [Solimonas terrae]|uniref:NfeD family protein n=1 Tax=Solimonas terrae TaxID=1396819 RepID=A0A6M2BWS8_9GAMM|nr:NfeD family protein [Solimonas terrae]NGY06593.1 NfeD family protein [Solimonas terrae]
MQLEDIVYWHWWVAGLVFLTLEAMMPGAIFLWMGISAGLVGLLALMAPGLGWQIDFVVFGVLAVASVLAWRRFRPGAVASDQPTLNRRGQSYVGRRFTLSEPLVNGVGTLRVDDSQWRISGSVDVPAGAQVRVIGVDGATLRVEQIA